MWTHKNTVAMGGLENVGFVPDKDFLIVLSSNGESIFDCLTGQRIARSYNNYDWNNRFNDEKMTVKGFDLFTDIEIHTSGLHGLDKLKKKSKRWSLRKQGLEIVLLSPNDDRTVVTVVNICELRAFGFSETDKSFIVASSCELIIYGRD